VILKEKRIEWAERMMDEGGMERRAARAQKVILSVLMFSLCNARVQYDRLFAEQSDVDTVVTLSFDQLFPLSCGGHILDLCVHMYEDLGLLQEISTVPDYKGMVADAMLGRAARLDYALQRMLKQGCVAGFSGLNEDDSAYIMALIEQIESICIDMGVISPRMSKHGADIEHMDVAHMLNTIKLRLKHIMQCA
jgi:hypothetical protein